MWCDPVISDHAPIVGTGIDVQSVNSWQFWDIDGSCVESAGFSFNSSHQQQQLTPTRFGVDPKAPSSAMLVWK